MRTDKEQEDRRGDELAAIEAALHTLRTRALKIDAATLAYLIDMAEVEARHARHPG
jgi:hypothetical protein